MNGPLRYGPLRLLIMIVRQMIMILYCHCFLLPLHLLYGASSLQLQLLILFLEPDAATGDESTRILPLDPDHGTEHRADHRHVSAADPDPDRDPGTAPVTLC